MTRGDVSHLAVLQNYGWIEEEADTEKSATSRAFASPEEAVNWLVDQVTSAHGEEPQVQHTSITTPHTDDSGTVHNVDRTITVVTSAGGPVWGLVVRV